MQQTAVNLLKTSWAPSNSWNFYTSHIIALELFCCHCRRCSYLSSIGLLQLCQVIQRSVNKADHCRCLLQWLEKIKLQEEAISEILIADTRLGIKKCFPTQ